MIFVISPFKRPAEKPDPWVDSDQVRPDPTRLKARRLLLFAPYIRRVSSIGSLFVISHSLKKEKRYSLSWPLTVPSRPWI
ncbi:hypothetical protein Bca4012_074584 [Brassica carinata]